MRRPLALKRCIGLAVLLATLFLCSAAAAAPVFNQDPGGGGGGGGDLCWSGSCAFCGQKCHEVFPDVCWDTCLYLDLNGNCACFFDDGCGVLGTCTYVP